MNIANSWIHNQTRPKAFCRPDSEQISSFTNSITQELEKAGPSSLILPGSDPSPKFLMSLS